LVFETIESKNEILKLFKKREKKQKIWFEKEKEIYDFSDCTYDKEIIEKTFFESKVPFIVEEPLAPELIIWQNMDFVNPKNKYSIWDRYGLLCFNYIAQVVFAILFSVALTEL
jgi:hypothetical protein